MHILERIEKHKRDEIAQAREKVPLEEMKRRAAGADAPRDFLASIRGPGLSLIGEAKKASPSEGVIRADFDAAEIAREYERGGASALSVLTDRRFFQGDDGYVREAKSACSLPVLRKDFILDEYQIYEARVIGADAVLLIVRMLTPDKLRALLETARELNLAALVEVHDQQEAKTAADSGATLIGINNRDLDTMTTDINVTLKLRPHLPDNAAVISESGVHTADDVTLLRDAGIDAVLIGTVFMRMKDIEPGVRKLMKQ